MDPEVSKAKFEREVAAVRQAATDFAAGVWEIVSTEFPLLEIVLTHPKTKRRVGFRYRCDNWDSEPPSLALFDPETKAELSMDKWPQGGWSAGVHPVTGKPFLCLPGIREYHTHESHLNEKWEALRERGTYTLAGIVDRVAQRFGATNG